MSVSDNRISAIGPACRRMLGTHARLAAWTEARELGLTPTQSDRIADAATAKIIATLEQWEAGL